MSTDQEETIYVRLIDEPVEVWRPVKAVIVHKDRYMLVSDQLPPDDEEWEFQPGEIVDIAFRVFDGAQRKIAVSREIA